MSERELQLQQPLVMTVPDALFASDNELDIPTLDLALQAEFVVLPWSAWGEKARSSAMPGTYHHYRQDYKINGLWASPQKLVNSGCSQTVEPNFSTNDHMPTAVGAWAIYRKRWLARYWQHYGIRTFVDLYVSTKFEAINLFGVPLGWQSYCTRVTSANWEHAIHDYEIATEHANGKPVLFVVYGGDRRMEQVCKQRDWVWLAEQMYVKEGRIHGLSAVTHG